MKDGELKKEREKAERKKRERETECVFSPEAPLSDVLGQL